MGPDLIVALAGMIIPSAVDFIKKKFLKKKKIPRRRRYPLSRPPSQR